MHNEKKLIKDDIDLISILSVLFDNFNLLLSIFLVSVFVVTIYYFSSEKIYQSESLLEIKKENSSFLPESLSSNVPKGFGGGFSLEAEIEIYKSDNTIKDAYENLKSINSLDFNDVDLSLRELRKNVSISTDDISLINVSFKSNNKILSTTLLNLMNIEFINDRADFARQSSAAGRKFINQEIPRIKNLLTEAEDNLNSFKISTNASDVIFDSQTTNSKLERLKNRVDEIEFKELELKEFYRENHPIYLTLSKQKKLILSQIAEIETDLPNIPNTQRTLENLKREVEIYSSVLSDLSSQELALGMNEASSISNVRIINKASEANKTFPNFLIYLFSILSTFLCYLYLLSRHFIGERLTNFDALIDYVGKDMVLGEFPLIPKKQNEDKLIDNIADELLNKTIYEITHSSEEFKSMAIVGSNKDVGKTEIAKRIFNKLKIRNKVCLLDLDYRKKALTKEISGEPKFKNFNDFYQNINDYTEENGSLFIPSFEVDTPSDFFTSDEFINEINKLTDEFDFILCDTPPWKLFVDAKIISKYFTRKIYISCNQLSTFKDIDLFLKDVDDINSVKFFFNKFNLYFNFLWYKYQYPYDTKSYYDYLQYSSLKKGITLNFLPKALKFFEKLFGELKSYLKKSSK